jgi:hypothetical protein
MVHHVLELFPVWSKERGSCTDPLLTRGAVEEEGPVRAGECRSWRFWRTTVWSPLGGLVAASNPPQN